MRSCRQSRLSTVISHSDQNRHPEFKESSQHLSQEVLCERCHQATEGHLGDSWQDAFSGTTTRLAA